MLGSSSVALNDAPVYAAGTTYAKDAKVIRTETNRIYKSLADANTGNTPESSPLKWLDVGPVNRWAMFDNSTSTKTAAAGSIVVTLAPGGVDSIGLVGVTASSVRVQQVNAGATVYDRTINLDRTPIRDLYEYFFEPFNLRSALALFDLPIYPASTITVTLSNPSGVAECGVLSVGRQSNIGTTVYGVSLGIVDYSRKEADEFGNLQLAQRNYSVRAEFPIYVNNYEVDIVTRLMAGLRATPAFWEGETEYDSMLIFGFYRDFSVVVSDPAGSNMQLQIEGMT